MSAVQVQADGYLGAAKLLRATVRSFVSSASRLRVTEPGANLAFGAMYYGLGAEIARAEHAGLTREQIREMVAPVREIFARSPFVRRAQAWPRGYPGDFETIEQLVAQANRAPEGTLAWLIESYCLGSPFAQQHRNKVAHQAALITDAILRPGPAPRVAIIAAGAAPDLRLVPPQLVRHGCRFVLNDYDPAALDLAKDLLGPVARCCAFIPGNVLRAITALAAQGPYDLVLAGAVRLSARPGSAVCDRQGDEPALRARRPVLLLQHRHGEPLPLLGRIRQRLGPDRTR